MRFRAILFFLATGLPAQDAGVVDLLNTVRAASYPDLPARSFRVKPLQSDFDYLQTRFTLASFFFRRRLTYLVMLNPRLTGRGVPPEALRAILAHELAHAQYYQSRPRWRLAGLARLLSTGYRIRFERGADLTAIELGYGPGLKQYREWLYLNIPPERVWEKKRDYFTPQEIEAIDAARARNALSH